MDAEKVKIELAEAYAKQVKLELELRNKNITIRKLKECIENLRDKIRELMVN